MMAKKKRQVRLYVQEKNRVRKWLKNHFNRLINLEEWKDRKEKEGNQEVHSLIEKMTNWQRNQWAKAKFETREERYSLETLEYYFKLKKA